MDNPEHVATFSCLTTTFFCVARLGEFTVKNLAYFDPQSDVKPSDVWKETDRNGLVMTVFRLPRTKTSLDQRGGSVMGAPRWHSGSRGRPQPAFADQHSPAGWSPVCIQIQKQTQATHQDLLPASSRKSSLGGGNRPSPRPWDQDRRNAGVPPVWHPLQHHENKRQMGKRRLPIVLTKTCPNPSPLHASYPSSARFICQIYHASGMLASRGTSH